MGSAQLKENRLQEDKHRSMYAAYLETPIGEMIAMADDKALYLLEFLERKGLQQSIEQLQTRLKTVIIHETTPILTNIEQELKQYFEGHSFEFHTPIHLMGTDFQQKTWRMLKSIPAGETRSYAQLAEMIQKTSAVRAVANANAANRLALMVPCHRVIQSNGALGGYGAGTGRKKWLLQHEKAYKHA